MHAAKRLEHKSDLFAAREKDDGFGLEVGFNERPEEREFLVEGHEEIVLFKVFGHCGKRGGRWIGRYTDMHGFFETQPREVGDGVGLSRGKEESLS
jgi:hypothetical protein